MRTTFSVWVSMRSATRLLRSPGRTCTEFRKIILLAWIPTTVCPCVSGLSVVFAACGSFTSTPFWSIGATSIMMINSTSMTSTSGVTLISALRLPFEPPTSIDIVFSLSLTKLTGNEILGFSSLI